MARHALILSSHPKPTVVIPAARVFLLSMWLHGVFVSASHATVLGLVYVVLRAIHPRILGRSLSKTQSRRVFFVTGPCYGIVF